MVKVHDSEEVANHAGPESCGAHREVCTEALIGDTGRLASSREITIQDAAAVG